MKGLLFRNLKKRTQMEQYSHQNDKILTEVLDEKLFYLNHSFENNLKLQEIYLDIMRNKNNIRASTIKDYYMIFTSNKAESIMFENGSCQKEDILETHPDRRDTIFNLKRLYARLIEKIVVKISYYLINKKNFSFLQTSVINLVRKSETLMKDFHKIKDLTTINGVIEKIYEENEAIQEQIIDQLVSKGYINSKDQFYRINGIDQECQQFYQRHFQITEQVEDQQADSSDDELGDRSNRMDKKYPANFNLQGDISIKKISRIRNDQRRQRKHIVSNEVHTAEVVEIESKFKNMVCELGRMISQSQQPEQSENIFEIKQNDREYEEDVIEVDNITETYCNSHTDELAKSNQSNHTETYQREKILKNIKRIDLSLPKNAYHKKTKHNIEKPNAQRSSNFAWRQSDEADIYYKQITIQSFDSNTMIPEISTKRQNKKKNTSPLFTRAFSTAIKALEKQHLSQSFINIKAKRLSQELLQYHRQSQMSVVQINLNPKQTAKQIRIAPIRHTLRKLNEEKSIFKLLNIYKNRVKQQYIGKYEKQFRNATGRAKCISKTKRKNTYQNDAQHEVTKMLKKQNQPKKKKVSYKLRQTRYSTKVPIFKNSQINHKLSPNLSQIKMTLPVQARKSLAKCYTEKSSLDVDSVMTSNGIKKFDLMNMQPVCLTKTTAISPTSSPLYPNFEIYDRIRRVVIR